MRRTSYHHASVLLFAQSSIDALLPSSLLAQAKCLLEDGKLSEAAALLDRTETEIADGGGTGSDQAEEEMLQYLHQCLAFTLLRQTRFREATQYFVKGKVDPRILISYFNELRPALFDGSSGSPASASASSSESAFNAVELKNSSIDLVEVEIWVGVTEHMPHERNIDDLIRNYSPYLRPGALPAEPLAEPAPVMNVSFVSTQLADLSTSESGTRTHPATIAIRQGLRAEAEEMLKDVLITTLGETMESERNDIVEVSYTALALLYAHIGDTPSLISLFSPTPSSFPLRPTSQPPSQHSSISPYASQVPPPPSILGTPPVPSISPSPATVLTIRTHVVASELAQLRLWGALVELWKVVGDAAKVVQVLTGLVDGTRVDPSVPDPLGQIFTILGESHSMASPHRVAMSVSEQDRRALIKQWGAWLTVRDVERGMNLLTSIAPRTRQPTGVSGRRTRDKEQEQEIADELAILSELKATEANDKSRCIGAAKRYLEWLTVGRGCEYGPLQGELGQSCIDELLECLGDESVVKLWRAKAASYASSSTPSSFLSYFSVTTPDSPSKRTRIKTVLVLQAMTTENAERAKKRIVERGWEKLLGLEMAVLSSKISPIRTTFRILHALRDTATAEAYASSGGNQGIVSARIGMSAAEGCGLNDWARWFGKCAEGGFGMERSVKCSLTPRDMLQSLIEVYIEEGDIQQTSRLLTSRGAALDAAAIIPLVPTSWPLHTLTPLLACSFRYMLHTAHEAQIVKAISTGQNLAVFEKSYHLLRDDGAVIEEALSDDEEDAEYEKGDGGEREQNVEHFSEKAGLEEKVGAHLGSQELDSNIVNLSLPR